MPVNNEHELYGEITGQLNLRTWEDVDVFLHEVKTVGISDLRYVIDLYNILKKFFKNNRKKC